MSLLGEAALAMWWDMAPAYRADFEDWHSHEHFPERLGLPGFRRGARWAEAKGGERFFVMYELADYQTLTSPEYVARLNNPTPWSTKLFPHHRNMVRSQCRVLETFGSGVAGFMLTVRFTPAEAPEKVRAQVAAWLKGLPARPGLTGGHLLRTDTPPLAQTAEQRIRGGADATADWIALVTGYDVATLEGLPDEQDFKSFLGSAHAQCEAFRLAFAATPTDLSLR